NIVEILHITVVVRNSSMSRPSLAGRTCRRSRTPESRETEPAPTVAPPRRLYEYGAWRVVDRLCDDRRLLRRCARCQTENEGSGSASISGIRPRRSGDESTLQGVCAVPTARSRAGGDGLDQQPPALFPHDDAGSVE